MVNKKTVAGSGKTVAKLKKKTAQKQKIGSKPMIRAMVWYREEHYQPLLSIFDNTEQLPPTYQDWLARAEDKKSEVEAAGD